MTSAHSERKHSKYSASGSERWLNCSGSVALCEPMPDKDTPWSIEGTKAHELLEKNLLIELNGNDGADIAEYIEMAKVSPKEMIAHVDRAAKFILGVASQGHEVDVLVETRIILDFISPDMFGTFDGAVVDHFGTLHVFDFKYGAGHAVSPDHNLQMIFYGLGLAHKYRWNFKKVRLWIIQPRIKGYDGPLFWDVSIAELKKYVTTFREGVERVEEFPNKYTEGKWCHWCKAKNVCPLKVADKREKGRALFSPVQ